MQDFPLHTVRHEIRLDVLVWRDPWKSMEMSLAEAPAMGKTGLMEKIVKDLGMLLLHLVKHEGLGKKDEQCMTD